MAKKANFDDVLGNKFSLMNAKSSSLLSSWMGAEPTPTPASHVSEPQDDDADLKQSDFGHDRLGVGSAIPKDIADGSFTRRAPTTNDKLLEQLIGKKRAKAHLAAKQEAERASARQQPAWQQKKEETKPEESEDEEEGRAALIASKRQRGSVAKPKPKLTSVEAEKLTSFEAEKSKSAETEKPDSIDVQESPAPKEESDDDVELKPKKRVKKSRAKPTSYLDELLAERSKKKKGKGKSEDI
ncbi:hypothetical protein C7974DRAFT_416462 [Boeremia exigua]|uniref:uncharacterized protein n=1 Tax=Boeremia exigua TaxID=749465 RepID=UPI001E8E78AC|nr:uncharacterized protein C7974DRAFT_416462 [Boeremia exigua]KAH6616316.1 hypothetical protein C7974DRAFT_416462 [Boeremia exigua]